MGRICWGNLKKDIFAWILYSRKAFREYNKSDKRGKREHCTLYFLEDQLNEAGTVHNDTICCSSQGKDKEPTQEYILLPLHPHRTRILVEDVATAAHEKPSKSSPKDNDVHDSEDVADKEGQHQMNNSATVYNKLSTVRTSVCTATTPYVCTASNSPQGILEVDSHRMTTINVSPIPTLRIHKDHPKDQILGDPKSAVQTRGKIQKASLAQQALVSYISKQNRTNHKDHQNYLLACFLSQEEPKNISQALQDESWVEAMQEELLQFKLQKVWILVDLPSGKKAIGTKWVFKNKRDERSIVVKNKARLVAQGFRQEEGIVFMSEALLPSSSKQIRREVIKALYGLHQAPRAWYETLSSFLMENGFRRGTIDKTLFIKKNKSDIMTSIKLATLRSLIFLDQQTATTPIESNKPLVKDEDGEDVDVHVYRSMIGSLMYLTASRPDIMFAVCACARFQVTPKASHLNAVKRIFRYLKHQPKLGLWYPRDSPFELEAFSDSDYRGANLNRKSTTFGCQFLGRRLISWQCKKQTIVVNSTTEAEYVAAANCCG
ncbi:putative ribonuclease H-like domain-containing protein [Tanacetum coccineum]